MKRQKSKHSTRKLNFYEEVTNQIIQLLEAGVAPWRKPWKTHGPARNFATGHVYRGINAFLMNLTPHEIPLFMNFNQAKAKGGHIRKGTKSSRVYFYKPLYQDANGKQLSPENYEKLLAQGQEVRRISFLKRYNLFNIEEIEGIEFDLTAFELESHEPLERCEQVIKNYPSPPQIDTEGAAKAYYDPIGDKINMPPMGNFHQVEEYYATLFHELTHSTGHKSRLLRKGIVEPNAFGSVNYSREELIAEMGASFLSAHTAINNQEVIENSAAYLQGWLKALKADSKLIFQAAAQAQKAVDYILNRQTD